MRKSIFRQPETIEEYTETLRRRLAGVLPPEKIDEVVAEAGAHLDDIAQDLRQEPDRFEREAVRRFVPACRLASGIARAWAPIYLRHRGTRPLQAISLALGSAFLLALLLNATLETKFGYGPYLLLAVPVLLLLFLLGLLACRPQPRRFVGLVLAACLIGTLWGGTKFGQVESMSRYISRFEAPARLAIAQRDTDLLHAEVVLLQQGIRHAFADAPRDERLWPAALRSPEGILLPRGYGSYSSAFHCDRLAATQPRLWYTHDPFKAERAWRRNGRTWLGAHINSQGDLQRRRRQLMQLMAAPRTRFDVGAARWLGSGALVFSGLLLLADLLGGTLGAALLRTARRWRARTAA